MARFRPSSYSGAEEAVGAAPWLSAASGLFELGTGAFDYAKTKKVVGQQLVAGQQQYVMGMEQIKSGRQQAAAGILQAQQDAANQRKTISLVVPAFVLIAFLGIAAKVYLSTEAEEE